MLTEEVMEDEELKTLQRCLKMEQFHIEHVRACCDSMPEIFGDIKQTWRDLFQNKGDEPGSVHDWSKDMCYLTICCIAFSMQKKELVEEVLPDMVEKHHRLEPHHPEH